MQAKWSNKEGDYSVVPGIIIGSLNSHKVKSAVIDLVQRSPYYPWFVRHSQCIRDFFNPPGQIRIRDWTWSQLSAYTRHKWMTCANSRPDPILILMARPWAGKSQFIIHYQFQFCLCVSEAVSDFNVLHYCTLCLMKKVWLSCASDLIKLKLVSAHKNCFCAGKD